MANIPMPEFKNLFTEDPIGQAFWSNWMGEATFAKMKSHYAAMGESGAMATPLSARADKLSPTLLTHRPDGTRAERISHHPDYHRLEELSYGRGIIAIKFDPLLLKDHRNVRHLVGFGAGYYFAQCEMGLYCPICMTDGVARVLERNAEPQLAKEVIAHLASRDMASLWQGSMYLTERQGGSDVGANEVTARQENGHWHLNGDKWFCSNVAADCILALARMPDGPAGTKGLGLFLVLRKKPANNSASIRIHRIKDKLGVRSMATGEITFENTEAFLIGGVDKGFKLMAEMLNLSRLYNSIASIACTRRAISEAVAYGHSRKAFGVPLCELAQWRSAMADVIAEFWGMFVLDFETVRALDQSDLGDDQARRLARLSIPMCKAITGKFSIFAVSECMEQIGGNAYIEESILPRLLRDCQVLPIWEGTTHILTLDSLRAIQKESSHEAYFARINSALKSAASQTDTAEPIKLVEARSKALAAKLQKLATASDEVQQRDAREWLEGAARTFSMALLLENAASPALKAVCLAAFARLANRPYSTAPVNTGAPSNLIATEQVLLNSANALLQME